MKCRTSHFRVFCRVTLSVALLTASPSVKANAPAKKAGATAKKVTKTAGNADDDLEAEFDAASKTEELGQPPPPKQLRPIADLRTALAKDEKNTDVRLELAEALEAKKDFAGMVEVLRPAADHLPRRGMLLLARGYGGSGEALNEIRVLELVIAQNPKDYYAQDLTGQAYSRAKKTDEAIERFSESKKLNPKFEQAYLDLLAEYKKSAQSYEALALLNDMVKAFGERPFYLNELCGSYSDQGYIDKALEACPKAMAIDRNRPENHLFYAQALTEHEQQEKAQKVLETAARMFPQSEITQWTAGSAAFEQKNYLASYRYFDQCTKADAKSSRCWLSLAKSASELQKQPEALNAFSKACLLNRAYTGEVRKAAAALRQKKDDVWPQRYETAINRCSAVTGSAN